MESLARHGVYTEKLGRVFDFDENAAPDIITVGMASVSHGSPSPLEEFNDQYDRLRQRRELIPVATLFAQYTGDALTTVTTPSIEHLRAEAIAAARRAMQMAAMPSMPIWTQAAVQENEDADVDTDDDLPELTDLPDSDDEGDDDDDEDLFADSPTLLLAGGDDVALDMDEIPEWSLDAPSDSDSSGDDYDDEDGGDESE